jgi:anti-anti-sigma factor
MRTGGIVSCAQGLVPHGHLCWGYTDRSEFHKRAAEYMADGVAGGQWVEYVGSQSTQALRDELYGLDGMQAHIDDRSIRVSSAGDYCECGQSLLVDPDRAVESRIAAAEEVLAAGYTGFRAVVDCTDMARTDKQREAFARYEHLIDQKMSVLPVTALCAYNISELGSDAVCEMASLHPFVNDGCTPFRLYADEATSLSLAGEVDSMCASLLGTALERTVSLESGPELAIDCRGLEFIDHRGLLTLDKHARRNDLSLVLYCNSETVARVAAMLPLSALRIQQAYSLA